MPAETASAGVFTFRPIERPVDGTVVIPGSKSITNGSCPSPRWPGAPAS